MPEETVKGQDVIVRLLDAKDHRIDEALTRFIVSAEDAREAYSRRLGQIDDEHNATTEMPTEDSPALSQAELVNLAVKVMTRRQEYAAESATAAGQYETDLRAAADVLVAAMIEVL